MFNLGKIDKNCARKKCSSEGAKYTNKTNVFLLLNKHVQRMQRVFAPSNGYLCSRCDSPMALARETCEILLSEPSEWECERQKRRCGYVFSLSKHTVINDRVDVLAMSGMSGKWAGWLHKYRNERVKTNADFDISHGAGGIFNEPLLLLSCGMRATPLVKETPNFWLCK